MLSRLAQGVSTVLHELSAEETPDEESQDGLVPQLPSGESQARDPNETEMAEESSESLAHLEQLVVQLKELVREKDSQLSYTETQLKNEREAADIRFTKLKLQAKAKMTSLTKQIADLKGQETPNSPDSSFTSASVDEEELQELKRKLTETESNSKSLQERLQITEQLLQEKEDTHAEQLRVLQAVVCEKDVRFQDQIQRHEDELLQVTSQSQKDTELHQTLHKVQQRCEELEEALRSRSQVLEMLQQELNNADQQKQILTLQFRQMEQQVAEAGKQREDERLQWAQQASMAEAKLDALRVSQNNFEKERLEVARLESKLESVREEKEAALRANQEASEKESVEVMRLENELAVMKERELAAVQASHIALVRETEVTRLERELASLKMELEEGKMAEKVLADLWRGLRSLAGGDLVEEESPVPSNSAIMLDTLQALEAQLEELNEKEKRYAQATQEIETLHEQLHRSTTERDEAVTRIQQLEQQIDMMPSIPLVQQEHEQPVQDSPDEEKALIQVLKQQLLQRDSELAALREHLTLADGQNSRDAASGSNDQIQPLDSGGMKASLDSPTTLPDFLGDSPEDTTLVAEDSSLLSVSADTESSPELLGAHSESPGESKGTSSDEMVTSSDSEVAHSSWTILDAGNQDCGPEWPSVQQDLGQLQLQSWVETGAEQETSTIQMESPTVVIRETVQVQITQQGDSIIGSDETSSHLFAQALAEELQKRYSELLAELQRLKDGAAESNEKIQSLETALSLLSVAKEEAESHTQSCEDELKLARLQLNEMIQQSSSEMEKQSVETQLLEEQLASVQFEKSTQDQKIHALQGDLEEAQRALSEQEVQTRMLCAQLEDRELLSSELEQKLQDMESSFLQISQTKDMVNDSLTVKDTEISELQHLLAQKGEEMMELSDCMSAKLLQAGEEKFLISGEVEKLKKEIIGLQKVEEERKTIREEGNVVLDECTSLQKDKEELTTQLSALKKKFQVALLQRKELMKKVTELENEAIKKVEEECLATEESPASKSETEKDDERNILKMEAIIDELKKALKSKAEVVENLEQRISQQDGVLAETLALNQKLMEEGGQNRVCTTAAETVGLQAQMSSLESECETLQRKLLEAQDSRKDTIRKAKDKDRHHREQLKQQKEDYNELLERFELQEGEKEGLLTRIEKLEKQRALKEVSLEAEVTKLSSDPKEKPASGGWVQEDWVDFAAPDSEVGQQQSDKPITNIDIDQRPSTVEVGAALQALQEEVLGMKMARADLEGQLEETRHSLSLGEIERLKLGKELETLREKEKQVDILTGELDVLREKYLQAESCAENLKEEMGAAAKGASLIPSITTLQAEVEEFKQFINSKNQDIVELSQQLSEQGSLIQAMHATVSEKDEQIASLQGDLRAEQEKSQRLETEGPQKQYQRFEDEKGSEAKIQQLQRKLQAALISRKEALKETKSLKEELGSTETLIAKLQQSLEAKEEEVGKLRAEKERLIEEVDRTLLENQSLGASCESLKLVMEGMLTEKDVFKNEATLAKVEADKVCKEWEEKVQGMKEEYETLLKSYENVSDEAERVRRVLGNARQERHELASRMRTHEAARQEAERQVAEAQKEVESVKDKMRKYAKTKQQKIMDLEEEIERLREIEEKKGLKRDDRVLKTEFEKVKVEVAALKADLGATMAERDYLEQQAVDLKKQLALELEKGKSTSLNPRFDVALDESIGALQSDAIMTEITQEEPVESQPEEIETQTDPLEKVISEIAVTASVPDEEITEKAGELETLDYKDLLEDKLRYVEEALNVEKDLRREQEAEYKAELASLEQCLQEHREKEQSLSEETSRRESHLKELNSSLEAEKDNLEERLMNQLAQLNGSIAGYQQEAADSRERLVKLQHAVERLERECAELEAQAENERERAARLEEDKRQAQRERAEAEAESGKQRELEQQLKSAQRVREGSQSRARQLEELLREKQLEVRQMQRDCIHYQEKISELGRNTKTLQLGSDELRNELDQARQETAKTMEDLGKSQAELGDCKAQLDEAQKRASQTLVEKEALVKTALQREAELKAEAEQTLDSVRFRLGAELKQLDLRLEEAYNERDREEDATIEARGLAEHAERQAQEMQARLDESLARLAAFSRCMSSLQDDRDRVLDETRQWETRFNSTLQGKEAEVREAETRSKDLTEQLQKETAQREELQLAIEKLKKSENQWQQKWNEEEIKQKESLAASEKEIRELKQALSLAEGSLTEARVQLASLESETEALRHRVQALEEAVGMLQGEANQARAELKEREAEERRLGLSVEQLETDLRSSKVLTESLQTELGEKERREVELLGEKEQAVTQAAEEARKEAESRAKEAEGELEERRDEARELENRLRKAEEDSSHSKARLDSFTKAMGSLQNDRDRVLGMYKQLEEKHLQVMMEKDGLIQEAAGENNSLKEELRSLLVQRDDLHAEKAKLSAQLHGYRDDLNQVLSMKDSQQKQLLANQMNRISALETEKEEMEALVRNLAKGRETGEVFVERVERETLSQTGDSQERPQVKDAPGAEVEKLREQLQATRAQLEALQENLSQKKHEQDATSKELAELRWEGGVMRTESESAQERVAELAKDLLVVEQRLLEEKEASTQLQAQNQSFGQAMASLQHSRDQALIQVQELSLRLEELSKAGIQSTPASPGGSTGEVWGLKNALQALQNDRERLLEQLQMQHVELQKQQSELSRLGAGELLKVSQDLQEERHEAEKMSLRIKELQGRMDRGNKEIEVLRLERSDWLAQTELLRQQTLATLSERDQQVRHLSAMLEEAHMPRPKLLEEQYQREGIEEVASAPGAPQERSSPSESQTCMTELKELQSRLDEELEHRIMMEEQLMAAQGQLKRYTQGDRQSAHDESSDTAVLIEPREAAITRNRSSGPGLRRMLRVAFCSRQRTPLLFTLYLLTVHALLLLCLGGFL